MKLYFAYGANLNIDSMEYRCPDAVAVEPCYLSGWRLGFSGVATIRPDPDGAVAGALWAISEADECSLDRFEGYPSLYRKETIQIDGMEVMVYVMNADYPSEPGNNYLMTIAQGYQDWNLDLGYLAEAVERTEQETYDYDLQRSTQSRTGIDRISRLVADDLYMESSNDVRWLRDQWDSHRYPSTFE